MEQTKLPFALTARIGAIWLLLLSSAMAFARDPMLSDAWSGTGASDGMLDASAWLALAAAVAIGFPRTSLAGALMATLIGAPPLLLAGHGAPLYLPTLAAALAWFTVWMHGRNHHAHASTLQGPPLTPHEHL